MPSPNFDGDIESINFKTYKKNKFEGDIYIQSIGNNSIEKWEIKKGESNKHSKISKKTSKGARSSVCVSWEQDTFWYQLNNNTGEYEYTNTTTETGTDCYILEGGEGSDPFNCAVNPYSPLCSTSGSGSGGGTAGTLGQYLTDPGLLDYYKNLNNSERAFFNQHPAWFVSGAVNVLTARNMQNLRYYDLRDGSNANAYLHATLTALNAKSWGDANSAKYYGQLHETGQGAPNNPINTQMDLANNDLGLAMYDLFPNDLALMFLAIGDAIDNGLGLRKIDPDGTYSPLVPTNQDGKY